MYNKLNMKVINKNVKNFSSKDKVFEAGIALTGPETKAAKGGFVDLNTAYIKIVGLEAYLINAKVFPYKFTRQEGYDETRTKKLLLHKKEILYLKSKLDQGSFTIIPLSIYTAHNLIKVELALVRGKKKFEKKRQLKEKDLKRETERELKQNLR